jgi:protein TonB
VLVGKNGITKDIKDAVSFVAVKHYPNGSFEHLDYILHGTLQKLRTYSDSNLSVLNGRSFEYDALGYLSYTGYYSNNLKTGNWDHINDTGAMVKREQYEKGVLINADVKDTVKKKDPILYGDEREADFKGGSKNWINYLQKNIDQDAKSKSVKGGRVVLRFMLDTLGASTNIYLQKSVEFVLDEEAIKVIQKSPVWIPALHNGKTVNAYRRQPFTFIKE